MEQYREESPRITKILKIIQRSPTIKSYLFHDKRLELAQPGQFTMVWIPGVDEIPMSITIDPQECCAEIVVKAVGKASKTLHTLQVGDFIGVRGPYGTAFNIISKGYLLVVAGGTGIVPLRRLIETESIKRKITLILGAKCKEELIFLNEWKHYEIDFLMATDNGTAGFAGTASRLANNLISKKKYTSILCCGPEQMLCELIKIAESHSVPLQASLERVMKCGIGICGSCAIAGYRVCKEGPVFDLSKLQDMSNELGYFSRNHSGKKIPLNY